MKATELRIGNWVEYKGHYVIWDVSDFADSTAKRLSRPIPLTVDWLLKFGFKWEIFHQGFHNGTFKIQEKYNDGYYLYIGQERVHVNYVHQLQNLFFALCGEELKLTPSTA